MKSTYGTNVKNLRVVWLCVGVIWQKSVVHSRLWDIECGACLRVLEGHEELVRCIRFDNKRIVSGAYDGYACTPHVQVHCCNRTRTGNVLCVRRLGPMLGPVRWWMAGVSPGKTNCLAPDPTVAEPLRSSTYALNRYYKLREGLGCAWIQVFALALNPGFFFLMNSLINFFSPFDELIKSF